MQNPRIYGEPPFRVAVIHGGPGAGGEMAPVAIEISRRHGILEPIQTALSLPGQVEELKGILEEFADTPATLIGFSWGAWLSFILAALHPDLVRKLILVGSGPFMERYAPEILPTRLGRLSEIERAEVTRALGMLEEDIDGGMDAAQKDQALARMGELLGKADAFDPIPSRPEAICSAVPACDASSGEIFQGVWKDAALMRRRGELLALGKKIRCPVVAIHGSWDPHPASGVKEPLQAALSDFRFVLLDECGHTPWIEKRAKDRFYSILMKEIKKLAR